LKESKIKFTQKKAHETPEGKKKKSPFFFLPPGLEGGGGCSKPPLGRLTTPE